jgi:hypothetical protein
MWTYNYIDNLKNQSKIYLLLLWLKCISAYLLKLLQNFKLCFHVLNKILKLQETHMFVHKYIVIAYARLKKNPNVILL